MSKGLVACSDSVTLTILSASEFRTDFSLNSYTNHHLIYCGFISLKLRFQGDALR